MFYEIGEFSGWGTHMFHPTPLAREPCATLSGTNYNRHVSSEPGNRETVEYVFGSCAHTCDDEKHEEEEEDEDDDDDDATFQTRGTQEDVPECPERSSLGNTDDARKVVMRSALLYGAGGVGGDGAGIGTGEEEDDEDAPAPAHDGRMNPPGRAAAVRNTNLEDTRDVAHWYVASIPTFLFDEARDTAMGIVELEAGGARSPSTHTRGVH